jgi:hypothetical protein
MGKGSTPANLKPVDRYLSAIIAARIIISNNLALGAVFIFGVVGGVGSSPRFLSISGRQLAKLQGSIRCDESN